MKKMLQTGSETSFFPDHDRDDLPAQGPPFRLLHRAHLLLVRAHHLLPPVTLPPNHLHPHTVQAS